MIVMENKVKVKIRIVKDFRGGQDANLLAKKGKILNAVCSCPEAGFRGGAFFEVTRAYGDIWIIPEDYSEILQP